MTSNGLNNNNNNNNNNSLRKSDVKSFYVVHKLFLK